MNRSVIAICLFVMSCASLLCADTTVPEPSGEFVPPPPPEYALIMGQPQGPSLAVLRIASLLGTAGGIGLMVWGLGDVADAFGQGAGSAQIHAGLAITISGSVLAALSSTIFSLLKAPAPH